MADADAETAAVERAGRIMDADYVIDNGTLKVRVFCMAEDGEPFIAIDTDFPPYFYVIPDQDAVDEVKQALEEISFEDSGNSKRSLDRANSASSSSNGEHIAVQRVEQVAKTDGRERVHALQVVAQHPPHVPKIREYLYEQDIADSIEDTREFDIPFYKRYFVDNQLEPAGWATFTGARDGRDGEPDRLQLTQPPEQASDRDTPFNLLAFDLEVYEDEIFMCSFYADGFQKVLVSHDADWDADYVEVVDDEAALIERIVEVVNEQDPDVFLGYNTDEFDFDVLRDRAEEHNVTLTMGRTGQRMTFQRRGRFAGANLEGRIHLDIYAFVENVIGRSMNSDTLTLDNVAAELLGDAKEDVSWEEMKQYWEQKEELDLLAKYALTDAELAYKLGENLGPQIMSLSVLTGLPPFDVCRHTYGHLTEYFMIKQAYARNRLAPNRPTQNERSQRYQEGAYAGGFVYEPEKGLHDNIALFDFRSLYPTIIVSHNISPDVLNVEACDDRLEVEVDGNTYTFCQDEPGFIPDMLEDLVRERYDLKGRMQELDADSQAFRNADNRQQALKILSNSFYGYLGYNGARWYSKECAEATTYLGRKYIHDTIDIAEDMGLDVVYGDTDSVFINGDKVREKSKAFQKRVNEQLPAFMELELEGLFVRGLFTYTESGEGAKKKYALLGEDGSVKITGFEQVRRDWSQIAKDVQEQVIRHVLENEVDEAVEVVEDAVERLEAGEVPLDQVKIYTKLTKKPENYKSKSPHSEAAKKAIERGEDVGAGDLIEYVVTRGGGTISDRAELVDYAEDYDPGYYIKKQVVPAAARILKVFGYTEDQLLGKGKQAGLGRFT